MSAQHYITNETRELIIALIKQGEITYSLLSMDARIPENWLRKFANGSIERPDINRVLFLYENLSGNNLETILKGQ